MLEMGRRAELGFSGSGSGNVWAFAARGDTSWVLVLV